MSRTRIGRWIAAGAVLVAASAKTAAAQCIMCYMTANSTGEHGAHVLRQGIMILLIPTLSVFVGLFLLAYFRRHSPGGTDASEETTEMQLEELSDPGSDDAYPSIQPARQRHLPFVP